MLVSKTTLAGIAALAGAGFLALPLSAHAAASSATKECSAQYQAAKKAGTLNGQKWPQFYSDCAAKMKTDDSSAEDTSAKSKKKSDDTKEAKAPKDSKAAKETKSAASHQTTQQICSEQYQAAKSANTLGGKKWSQFYSDCAADIKNDKSDAAETPEEPKAEKAAMTKSAVPSVDKNGKPLTPGQIAFRQRIHECSVEWQRDKAANRLKGQKWPQYWSACNTRLKKDD
jgi:ubiquinone biosynthesis protein Coq4